MMSCGRLFVLAALLAVIGTAIAGCSMSATDTSEQRPIAVRITRPLVIDLDSRVSYVGSVHSAREIQVIAQIQGSVAALPVPEGGTARRGDVILRIDAPDLQAAVDRAGAERDYWRGHHEANLRLVEVGAVSREQVEVSRRAYRAAQASLLVAETHLQKGVERSPVNGTVLSWMVETGQHVMPGQPVLALGDANREVHIEVVQEDLERGIDVGTRAAVSSPSGKVTSVIRDISPRSTGSARTFSVKVPLPSSLDLRWGSSVGVDFIQDSRAQSTAVPTESLVERDGTSGIFLVRDGEAVWQSVVPGIRQDDLVEVSFPWNGQDAVATSNLFSLEDGVPVFAVMDKEDGR